MGKSLNHVGVAVRSIEEALPYWRDSLGLELLEVREVPSERVKVAFLDAGQTHVELLEATAEDSPIARFIAKRGEGVHHLCFDAPDIRGSMACLREGGARLLDEEPRAVGGGKEAAFIHPKSGNGVLVELYATARAAAD